jgi:acyl-CoA synthetase (AMP-forming)/AMP-acid ligase II
VALYRPLETVLAAGRPTVGALFRGRVAVNPDHRAVVDGDRVMTYRRLEERSNRLANAMTDRGLDPGDRVGLLARNCAEYVEVELAAAKAGLIVAALNWRLGDHELEHCVRLVEPKLLIAGPGFVETLDRLDLPAHGRILIGEEYERHLAAADDSSPDIDVDPEDGLVILYTSGTTGLSKGALISHRAMVARAMCFASEMEVPIGDNFIAWAPLYHMVSTDRSIATLLRGGTVHVVDGYLADKIIDIVEQEPMRLLVLVPGMVGSFTAALKKRRAKVKHVGLCGTMADLVSRQEIAAVSRYLNAPYVNTFGSTETGLPPATGGTIPVGVVPTSLSKRQSAFCEVRLVDPEDPEDKEVALGVPGEVAIRGPTLFSGYWNADEANAAAFRGGWFHMGDVMRRNPDGTLDYVDRVKYMIKSGGENIYPAEIENVLLADRRIGAAVVVRKADDKWGEVPVVFVVRHEDTLTREDVMARCRRDLSRYKQPKDVIFVEDGDLPRSTTGKVRRHELEKRLTND